MTEWKEYKFESIAKINPTESIPKGIKAKKVPMENLEPYTKEVQGYIVDDYKREVKTHLELSWIDHKKTKIGYTINFTKYFYEFKPL